MRRAVGNSPAERLGENLEDLSLHLEELPVRPIRLNRFSFPASRAERVSPALAGSPVSGLGLPGFFNILVEPDVVDGILLVRVAGEEELRHRVGASARIVEEDDNDTRSRRD